MSAANLARRAFWGVGNSGVQPQLLSGSLVVSKYLPYPISLIVSLLVHSCYQIDREASVTNQ